MILSEERLRDTPVLPHHQGAVRLHDAGPAAAGALSDRPGAGDPERQGRPASPTSTTATTGPSAPRWWSSATSTRPRSRPRSRPGSATGRARARPARTPTSAQVRARGADFNLAVEAGSPTTFELAWVTPPDLSPDTLAKRKREIVERLALAVLNRRLATLAREANPPFISAGAFRGNQLRADRVTGVLVYAQPDHWKEALATAETEVRRAVQFGVRPDELHARDRRERRQPEAGRRRRRHPPHPGDGRRDRRHAGRGATSRPARPTTWRCSRPTPRA